MKNLCSLLISLILISSCQHEKLATRSENPDNIYAYYQSGNWSGSMILQQKVTMGVLGYNPKLEIKYKARPTNQEPLLDVGDIFFNENMLLKNAKNLYATSDMYSEDLGKELNKFQGKHITIKHKGSQPNNIAPLFDSLYLPYPLFVKRSGGNPSRPVSSGMDIELTWDLEPNLDSISMTYPSGYENNRIVYTQKYIKDPGQLFISGDVIEQIPVGETLKFEFIRGKYKILQTTNGPEIRASVSTTELRIAKK